jgi:hypothetical protein
MNQENLTLEESIQHMIAISTQIITLDLEEEDDVAGLEKLQQAQEELRHRMVGLLLPPDKVDTNIQRLMRTAYDMELQVNMKLKDYKDFVSSQLHRLQEGSRMKNAYHQAYSQSEGYFVDNKK